MYDYNFFSEITRLSNLPDEEHIETRAYREYDDDSFNDLEVHDIELEISDHEIAELISNEARDLVIFYEVTNKKRYNKKYIHPIWPGLHSGVTIGIGYDLGYQRQDKFIKTWQGLISDDIIDELSRAVGVKGLDAKSLTRGLKHISVPWDVALLVFQKTTMPIYGRKVLRTFPNALKLDPHAFGAMFSLVYNRGTSLKNTYKRREMINIRDHMALKEFDKIPAEFRNMKKHWPNLRGLRLRREAEAKLFEKGLSDLESFFPGFPINTEEASNCDDLEGLTEKQLENEAFFEESLEEEELLADGYNLDYEHIDLEGSGHEPWQNVTWADDKTSPDYAHQSDLNSKGQTFEFGAMDLELLIRANSFIPSRKNGKIVFALRGAELVTSLHNPRKMEQQVGRDVLTLRDIRPDHKNFNCIIGVYNLTNNKLSAFISSTVPTRYAVHRYKTSQTSGNMLPTGCYRFTVFWHQFSKKHKRTPGCLTENGRQRAVIRSINNLRYDGDDIWENHRLHGDNLHPAFGPTQSAFFSSFGCLVIKGTYHGRGTSHGKHIGEWAKFREELGLDKTGIKDHGKIFDVVLLTGTEAALASQFRILEADDKREKVKAQLVRLRQGSKGHRVLKLERHLGQSQTGIFGPKVARALSEFEKEKFHQASGIFSPARDKELGWQIFLDDTDINLESFNPISPEAEEQKLEALYYEIGLRSKISINHSEALYTNEIPYDNEIVLESFYSDFIHYGQNIVKHIERSFYQFICGDGQDEHTDRQRVKQLFNQALERGIEELEQIVLSILLRLPIPIPKALAELAAEILVRRLIYKGIVQPVYDDIEKGMTSQLQDICVNWSLELRKTTL